MKNLFFSASALLLCVFTIFFAAAHTNAPVHVSIDGRRVVFADQTPVIVEIDGVGRTLVPVRGVFESLGFDVDFDVDERVAILENTDYLVRIPVGSATFTTNGISHTLDVPAQLINDRTMLPIRAVLESVGFNVDWDDAARTVIIETDLPNFMTIPNRRLTTAERDAWIAAYNARGGKNAFEAEVLRLVNIEREREGITPLQSNHTLNMAARFKAQSMRDLNYFAHTSPVYGRFDNIASEVFGFQVSAFAENIAFGQQTPAEVVNAWMNSPGHRANIMNPTYRSLGVGFYDFRWVQKFSN